jgi:uncharacterized protein affecting Mg2+/Co2+ transport
VKRIIIILALSQVVVLGQTDYKSLYFDWTSIPAYTNYASTDLLEPGQGELGFATSNFCIWSLDTTGYDTRTVDLLFRIGVIPHMEFGIKYSSPKAVVLDLRGGFEAGRFEFTGSAGFGFMKATKFVQPGNWTYWLFDGYPTVSMGYEIFPWLRPAVSAKGIISHYVRERVDPAQNFTTFNIGYTLMLDIGTEQWRVRPEINRYWGITDYTLSDEDVRFNNHSFGIGALYRPSFKKD